MFGICARIAHASSTSAGEKERIQSEDCIILIGSRLVHEPLLARFCSST